MEENFIRFIMKGKLKFDNWHINIVPIDTLDNQSLLPKLCLNFLYSDYLF
jgi:hypothetical protein